MQYVKKKYVEAEMREGDLLETNYIDVDITKNEQKVRIDVAQEPTTEIDVAAVNVTSVREFEVTSDLYDKFIGLDGKKADGCF